VVLVIIDPISSYLGKTDSHKNAEVRGVLEPLSAMADRTGVAVLSVTHFSKAGSVNNAKALHRFIGSIAFVGAPRAAFIVIEDAEDKNRRLFLHAKNNLAEPAQGLAFGLRQTMIKEGLFASHVRWEVEPVTVTANEALAAEKEGTRTKKIEEAKTFLKDILADGPVAQTQIEADAEDAGHSWATVRRAKKKLKLNVIREGFGPGSVSYWALPDTDAHIDGQNAHTSSQHNVSTYEENEHLCTPSVEQPTKGTPELPELPAFLDRRQPKGCCDGSGCPYCQPERFGLSWRRP
jgi:putative DNA primase/helicase